MFVDPEDGYRSVAGSLQNLVRLSATHRKANEIDVPINFAEFVEDWICRRIPEDFVEGLGKSAKKKRRPGTGVLTLGTVQAASTIELHAHRDAGRICVSPPEAERRAQVCLKCDMNSSSTACMSCRGLVSWIRGWIHGSTTVDKRLYVCKISAIMNIVHVHMTESALASCTPDKMVELHPEHCWKRKLLEKHNG